MTQESEVIEVQKQKHHREWLVRIRKKFKFTQEVVAKKANIARTTYAMIETGERTPTVQNAKRIAKVLEFQWTLFFEDSCHETCKNNLHDTRMLS